MQKSARNVRRVSAWARPTESAGKILGARCRRMLTIFIRGQHLGPPLRGPGVASLYLFSLAAYHGFKFDHGSTTTLATYVVVTLLCGSFVGQSTNSATVTAIPSPWIAIPVALPVACRLELP